MEWIKSRHAREREREREREKERKKERETEFACVPLKSSPVCCTGLGIFFLSMEYPV